MQAELLAITGQRTVPNIFVKGHHVGGSDALASAIANGRLAELVAGDRVKV